jgi:hypothetical protein
MEQTKKIENIILFVMGNNPDFDVYPIKEFYDYLCALNDLGQLICVYDKDEISGIVGYFNIDEKELENIAENSGKSWYVPKNCDKSGIIFIDILVIKKGKKMLKFLIDKIKEKESSYKRGCWVSRKNQFKIIDRGVAHEK